MDRLSRRKARLSGAPEIAPVFMWMLGTFMVLEYARPAVIVNLKLQMLIILAFFFTCLAKTKYLRNSLIVGQVIFWVLMAKGLPYAVNTFYVYFESRVMFGTVATAAAIAWVTQIPEYSKAFIWVWVGTMVYGAIYAMLHNGFGPGGMIGDENDVALACSVGLAFTLFGIFFSAGRARQVQIVLSALLISGIVASNSRGGFLAALTVVGYAILVSKGFARKIVLPLIAVGLFLLFAPEEYKAEVMSIVVDAQEAEDEYSTGLQRKYLWATATNMFLENPILGVGAGNFPWNADSYQPMTGDWPEHFFGRGRSGQAVHSSHFQLISEMALPGILVFGYLTLTVFRRLKQLRAWADGLDESSNRRHYRIMTYGVTGALLGYLVGGVFLSTLYYPHFWYLLGVAAGIEEYHKQVVRSAAISEEQPSASERRTIAETSGPARAAGRSRASMSRGPTRSRSRLNH